MKWLFNDWVLAGLIIMALALLLLHKPQPYHAKDWQDGFSYGVMFAIGFRAIYDIFRARRIKKNR